MKVGDRVKLTRTITSKYKEGDVFTISSIPNSDTIFIDNQDVWVRPHEFELVPEKLENKLNIAPEKLMEIIGATQQSSTGSLRYNSGKPQLNEISPKFLLEMGAVLEKSRQKYPRGNWEKGNNYSVPYDSMMRHLLAWQSGESIDKESGLSHLAHAALNLMMLHYYESNYPEFDDRIFKKEKK